MRQTWMLRTRVYKIGETQLPDTIEPLEIRMLDQIVKELRGNANKTVNWIVDDFSFIHRLNFLAELWRENSNSRYSILPTKSRDKQ